MVITIGQRASGGDAVAELLACHDRIRSFLALARRIGVEPAPATAVADAAARVRRYFVEALPRHQEDEELSLLPRLRGRSLDLDAALAAMHGEHREHAAREARLIAITGELAAAPERLDALRGELVALATTLEAAYREHLAGEERLVFPALAALPDPERDAVLAEMRGRRQRAPA